MVTVSHVGNDPPQSASELQPQPPATVTMHAMLVVFVEQSTWTPVRQLFEALQVCAGT